MEGILGSGKHAIRRAIGGFDGFVTVLSIVVEACFGVEKPGETKKS